MARQKRKTSYTKSKEFAPLWVKILDSQRRKVAKNLDYRLMATHLGIVSRRQVPRSAVRGIYNRLWPIVSPQSFRHYVVPAYMAVPDIDRSIEEWRNDRTLVDGEAPRMYVVETYNYERLDKTQAPEVSEELGKPVLPWDADEARYLIGELDEHNKPYVKPIIRELDPNYDPLDETEPVRPGLRSEYRVETLADMLGGVGYVEEEKAIVSQVIENEYQILIPAIAVEEMNQVRRKTSLTGAQVRVRALAILAKRSVLCYPTFCTFLGEEKVTIQMFNEMLRKYGYHRTGTVGKTAIFRPWSEIYPEGVPAHVLGIEDAGPVPA